MVMTLGKAKIAVFCVFLLLIGCSPRILFNGSRFIPIEKLSYSSKVAHYLIGQQIVENMPLVSGGVPDIFSIRPNLPAGLQLDAATGVISGTPTSELISTEFTVVAKNALGTMAAQIVLSAHDFGDGSYGNLIINTPNTIINNVFTPLTSTVASGDNSLLVASTAGFQAGGGDLILVIQMQNYLSSGILNWEFSRTTSAVGAQISLTQPLAYSYFSSSATFGTANAQAAQVILVPQYKNLTITSSGSLTAHAWNAATGTGGVVIFHVNDTLSNNVGGVINATGLGFSGGPGGFGLAGSGIDATGYGGESWPGVAPYIDAIGGGAGGSYVSSVGPSAIAGLQGSYTFSSPSYSSRCVDLGANYSIGLSHLGIAYGFPNFTNVGGSGASISLGSGGSGAAIAAASAASCGGLSESGGAGGGIILIYSKNLKTNGSILAQGHPFNKSTACICNTGGPGSGGSIYLRSLNMDLGSNLVDANGGLNNSDTPVGSDGRIQLDYMQLSGQTSPLPGQVLNGVGVF